MPSHIIAQVKVRLAAPWRLRPSNVMNWPPMWYLITCNLRVGGIDKYSTTVFLEKLHTYYWSSWLASFSQWHAVQFKRVFNDKNDIFSTLLIYRKIILTIKSVTVFVSFFHFAPFCLYATCNTTDLWRVPWLLVTIFYDRCRHNLQSKMAASASSVHPIKNCIRDHFVIYPTNKSCS